MPQFFYIAYNAQGLQVSGDIVTESEREAVAALRAQGLCPSSLRAGKPRRRLRDITFGSGVKKRDVALLCRQAGSMLSAGVPVSDALAVAIRQERKPGMRAILSSVLSEILAGSALSWALEQHHEFSAFVVNMVRVGEQNGRLAESFCTIADTLEREVKVSGRVKNALIYPAVLLCISLVVLVVLVIFVLPVFEETFKKVGADMPPLTAALMSFSVFFRTWGAVILPALTGLIAIAVLMLRTERGRRLRDGLALSFPVGRGLVTNMMMSRFSRCMSVMLGGGVDIMAALSTTSDVLHNSVLRRCMSEIARSVESGGQMHAAMLRMKEFTPMVVSFIRVGEEAGNLDEVLGRCAAYYDDETERGLAKLVALMEPLVTIVLALFVAAVVISVVQPMFQIYSLIA